MSAPQPAALAKVERVAEQLVDLARRLDSGSYLDQVDAVRAMVLATVAGRVDERRQAPDLYPADEVLQWIVEELAAGDRALDVLAEQAGRERQDRRLLSEPATELTAGT